MWKWLLLLFALSFCAFAIQSGDVLMYLSLARDFLLEGKWEQVDPYLYSNTDGQLIWIHEYLGHLVFYGAWSALGAPGLILLKMCALGAMFWLTLSQKNEKEPTTLWVLLWILAVLAGSFRYIERSSMFSDLFSVLIVFWLLPRRSVDRGLIVRLSLLFLLWIQLHPGFVVGLVFVGAWAAWCFVFQPEFRNRRALWLLLPPALLLLNPEGFSGVLYPFQFSLNEAKTLKLYNFEWFPSYHPAFRFAPEVIAYWVLCAAVAIVFWKEKAWRTLNALFALVAFAICLQAVRFMPWSAMVLVMCARPYATTKLRLWSRPALRYALMAALVLLGARNFLFGYHSSSGQRIPRWGFDKKFFPSETLNVLKQHRQPGNLYNSHDLGSSLIWARMTPIFHHGFVTDMRFFREEAIGAIGTREQFLALAAKYNWTMLLVDKYGGYKEIHRILSPIPEWKIVAEDEAAYLIFKMPPEN